MKQLIILLLLPFISCSSTHEKEESAIAKTPQDKLRFEIEAGNLEGVKNAIAEGADPNFKYHYPETSLLLAAERGNLEIIQFLLDKKADIKIKGNGEYNQSILFYAARSGKKEVVQFFLNKGFKIDEIDNYKHCILPDIASSGNLEYFKELEKEPRLKKYLSQKESRLDILIGAVTSNNLDFVKYLLEDKYIYEQKEISISFADVKSIKTAEYLLSKGANINQADNTGYVCYTALHRSDLDLTKFLVERGAFVNPIACQGVGTPLEKLNIIHMKKNTDSPKYIYLKSKGAKETEELTEEDCDEAIRLSIERWSGDVVWYNIRGQLRFSKKKYLEAEQDFLKVIQKEKNDADSFFYLGYIEGDVKKNYKKAIEYYSKAIQLDSGILSAYNNRGIAYIKVNNKNAACSDYKKLKSLVDEGKADKDFKISNFLKEKCEN